MKIRNGFVSNSSSSSFVISKEKLTEWQIDAIWNHNECATDELGWYECDYGSLKDAFRVSEGSDNTLELYASMDNFPMSAFLDDIGIDPSWIFVDDDDSWDEEHYSENRAAAMKDRLGRLAEPRKPGKFPSQEFYEFKKAKRGSTAGFGIQKNTMEFVDIVSCQGGHINSDVSSPDVTNCYARIKISLYSLSLRIITDGNVWALTNETQVIKLLPVVKSHCCLYDNMTTRVQNIIRGMMK